MAARKKSAAKKTTAKKPAAKKPAVSKKPAKKPARVTIKVSGIGKDLAGVIAKLKKVAKKCGNGERKELEAKIQCLEGAHAAIATTCSAWAVYSTQG